MKTKPQVACIQQEALCFDATLKLLLELQQNTQQHRKTRKVIMTPQEVIMSGCTWQHRMQGKTLKLCAAISCRREMKAVPFLVILFKCSPSTEGFFKHWLEFDKNFILSRLCGPKWSRPDVVRLTEIDCIGNRSSPFQFGRFKKTGNIFFVFGPSNPWCWAIVNPQFHGPPRCLTELIYIF